MKLKLDSAAKRRNLMATSVLAGVAAFGVPAAILTAATLAPSAAMAQDYTSGTFIGHVTDSAGVAVSGASVTVRSAATGVTRTSTTDSTGTFRAALIPTGTYSVTIKKAGFSDIAQDGLAVRIGGESNYGFTLTNPNDVDAVVVVAKKPQPQLDFSQTTKGIAIDVEQLQKQVPIARNVTAVALLAPGVITAVSGFTSTDGSLVPSIGGGSAGENAFYLNGLNITNFDDYIGGATVPFDFYKTIEIKTGGYPAEFGRATGGVINAVTKSGTNDLYFAVHGNYTPNFLRETAPNTYATNNARSEGESYQTSIELGGPLWRDHLFAYGLYQFNDTTSQGASNTGGSLSQNKSTSPFYGYKIDYFLTSRQHFEFTDFNTSTTTKQNNFLFTAPANNYLSTHITGAAPTAPNYINGGDAMGTVGPFSTAVVGKNGGNNFVAKYTGTFTDWFTLSGAYGRSHDESTSVPTTSALPYVGDARANGTSVRLSPSVTAAADSTFQDFTFREFYRVDADLYANFLGKHHFRAGYDNEDTTLSKAEDLTGAGVVPETIHGGVYNYGRIRTAAQSAALGLPINQEYVRLITEDLGAGGASITGTNQSFYIQDSWDVTRRLNLQLGVRDDIFKLKNLTGQQALNLDDNFAARVAVSYDPFGHSTDKIFASYGRYFIPPASNLSFRGADLYTYQYFLPPGGGLSYTPYINAATGAPTALGAILGAATTFGQAQGSTTACPVGVPRTGSAGCIVYGDGSQEPGPTKSAKNLSATYEDEFIIGYQKKLNNLWSVSATVTYRNLGNVSEDIDNLDQGIIAFCAKPENASHVGCNLAPSDISATIYAKPDYAIINPGHTAIVTVRSDAPAISPVTGLPTGLSPLAGQTFTLTPDELGFPKPKREYYALELAFERAFDGKWSLNGNYTLSKSVGNYEGTVKSDAGNGAQTDAGSTEEFDYAGLEDGAYGLLPNHRAHQIKLYGSYQLFKNFLVGANMQVTSPIHYGCLGVYPAQGSSAASGGAGGIDPVATGYGAVSHYCFNPTLGYSQLTPRASSFEGDWYYQFDISARFTVPKFNSHLPGDLVLRADVFNLFNFQQVTQYDEVGDSSASTLSGTYKLPLQYQTPRYVRLGFDLTF